MLIEDTYVKVKSCCECEFEMRLDYDQRNDIYFSTSNIRYTKQIVYCTKTCDLHNTEMKNKLKEYISERIDRK